MRIRNLYAQDIKSITNIAPLNFDTLDIYYALYCFDRNILTFC